MLFNCMLTKLNTHTKKKKKKKKNFESSRKKKNQNQYVYLYTFSFLFFSKHILHAILAAFKQIRCMITVSFCIFMQIVLLCEVLLKSLL